MVQQLSGCDFCSFSLFFFQTFHFNFFVTPKELFDLVILISVVNSKLSFQEALLGSHKLDVGFVYNQPSKLNSYELHQ